VHAILNTKKEHMIALGVRIVGGLMTAALVAVPACTSRNVSSTLKQYALFSLLFGMVACIVGIIASQMTTIAVGPLIIISSAVLFATSFLFQV